MVWIHGGVFTYGSSSWYRLNGQNIAARSGVVVVSFNYRLGPFGFLAHPALGARSGNYGLLDQHAALGWVKSNIAAFGGDPDKVTILGNSVGGTSVCNHLASARSRGLFHRAVIQSGPCQPAPHPSLEEAENFGRKFSEAVGCNTAPDVAACLRKRSAQEVLFALPLDDFMGNRGAIWGPVVDGAFVTQQPLSLMKAGKFNKVPLLIGSNSDEGTLNLSCRQGFTEAQYITLAKKIWGDNADTVLQEYPSMSYASPAAAAADALGDFGFVCPTRTTARAVSAAGLNTYLYHFTQSPSFCNIPNYGAFHTAEIFFVFHTTNSGRGDHKGLGPDCAGSFRPQEAKLSLDIIDYWTRFARTGDPNAKSGAVSWPVYNKSTDKHLELGTTIRASSNLKKIKCDFWAAISTP